MAHTGLSDAADRRVSRNFVRAAKQRGSFYEREAGPPRAPSTLPHGTETGVFDLLEMPAVPFPPAWELDDA